jgi:hypothetical protein
MASPSQFVKERCCKALSSTVKAMISASTIAAQFLEAPRCKCNQAIAVVVLS